MRKEDEGRIKKERWRLKEELRKVEKGSEREGGDLSVRWGR